MDNRSYQDHFFRKAKISGYRSRSAFKLIELNSKFKFLKNGIKLLDVGSFPGGWSQVAAEKINVKDQILFNSMGTKFIKNLNRYDINQNYITDKAPLNFRWIGLIKLILPNSKIIHCTRDPKDNCLSLFKIIYHYLILFSIIKFYAGEKGKPP